MFQRAKKTHSIQEIGCGVRIIKELKTNLSVANQSLQKW